MRFTNPYNLLKKVLTSWRFLLIGFVLTFPIYFLGRTFKAVEKSLSGVLFSFFIAIIFSFFLDYFWRRLEEEPEKIKAFQSHLILKIANQTLPYLREGLTRNSATNVAKIILKESRAFAISVTDKDSILAFEGAGSDHHQAGGKILTKATRETLKTGKIQILHSAREIGCPVKDCPLKAAILVPLKKKNEVIGSLKIYFPRKEDITESEIAIAEGLAHLLETQLELSEISRLETLACEAELKTLQAQINPHFFFNILNTAVSFCRTNPMQARDVLITFSSFFRHALEIGDKSLVPLDSELKFVQTYLELEKKRFGERINFSFKIPSKAKSWLIPPFSIQPIVENSVQHGMVEERPLFIEVSAHEDRENCYILIADNGRGIKKSIQKRVLEKGFGSNLGLGLALINERIQLLFGDGFGLKVQSEEGEGTKVYLFLPKEEKAKSGEPLSATKKFSAYR